MADSLLMPTSYNIPRLVFLGALYLVLVALGLTPVLLRRDKKIVKALSTSTSIRPGTDL